MCLLRGTDWIFIYNCTLCPHSVFGPRPVNVEPVVDKLALEHLFLPALRVCTSQYHSTNARSMLIFIYMLLLSEERRAKPGNLPKKECFVGKWGEFDRKVLSLSHRFQKTEQIKLMKPLCCPCVCILPVAFWTN